MAKPTSGMTAREYFAQVYTGKTILELARETGVPRTTLAWHLEIGKPMRAKTARKLEAWSGGKISAMRMLEKGEIS